MKKDWIRILLGLLLAAAMLLPASGIAEEAMEIEAIEIVEMDGAEAGDETEIVAEVNDFELFADVEEEEAGVDSLGSAESNTVATQSAAYESNAAGVAINATNFPDAKFRSYVKSNFDLDGNGSLSDAERSAVWDIDVTNKGIASLEGIEFFNALTWLDCSNNKLTYLYLYDNPDLNNLYCYDNQIAWLDLSYNKKLEGLGCSRNKLTELDVGGNKELNFLSVDNNKLSKLNLANNKKLEILYCDNNNIATIDIANCTLLKSDVKKGKNNIYDAFVEWAKKDADGEWGAFLSIDRTTQLMDGTKTLFEPLIVKVNSDNFPAADFRDYVEQNFDKNGDDWLSKKEIAAVTKIVLRSADDYYDGVNKMNCSNMKGIEHFVNLESLEAAGCNISKLNLTKNTKLETLDIQGNKLTSLNVTKNTKLFSLGCDDNQIGSLDVRQNKNLDYLSVTNNKLTSLDVSKNTKLTTLQCDENKLKKLNIKYNKSLDWLSCGDNQLTSLDVSQHKALTGLQCGGNKLKKLNVSKNVKLEWLHCANNQLTSLNVSKNTKLEGLSCGGNKLKKLDVTKNKALEALYCESNRLTALDVSKNTKLKTLWAQDNKIKSIALKNNAGLRSALKQTKKKSKKYVQWGKKESWGFNASVYIDVKTKLTNGKKVLYKGK